MTPEQRAALREQFAEHVYLSTACWHDEHAYCQAMTGMQGAKRPAQCKWCEARCTCSCHAEASSTSPS